MLSNLIYKGEYDSIIDRFMKDDSDETFSKNFSRNLFQNFVVIFTKKKTQVLGCLVVKRLKDERHFNKNKQKDWKKKHLVIQSHYSIRFDIG